LAHEDDEIAKAARSSDEILVNGASVQNITSHLNEGNPKAAAATDDYSIMKDFRPHILHRPHKPCPIAMVNRQPRGSESKSFETSRELMYLTAPGHGDTDKVPQNVAWLSAIKYAEQSVFM
jgi:hypothetical protein